MTICYIDCSPFMRELMAQAALPLPEGMRIHVGDPEHDDIPGVIGDARIVLNGHTYMDAETIAKLRNVERIIFLGTGATSYIDVAAAAARSIRIDTIRGYGDRSVAEHAFALMLACARQIASMDRTMREGLWQPLDGIELGGRTLGIIGAGGIGLQFAELAHGFGMEVLLWNRSPVAGEWKSRQVSLERLLGESDIVSLHLALTRETSGFLGNERLRAMKPGAILINTARAGLVDDAALIDLLESGHIAHAGLDVFAAEPPVPGGRLQSLPNVTLTAHAAYKTPEASLRLMKRAFAMVEEALAA